MRRFPDKGGAYAGSGTQTETSSVEVLVNLNSAGSFALGLFDGAVTDAAAVSVTLDVSRIKDLEPPQPVIRYRREPLAT
jgi:hypothetical protein